MKVKREELRLNGVYNLRHYGQVWLQATYQGLVDNERLCKFYTITGDVVYFDVKSTRWDAYIGPANDNEPYGRRTGGQLPGQRHPV